MVTVGKVKRNLTSIGKNIYNDILVLCTKKAWIWDIFHGQTTYLLTLFRAKIVLVKGDPELNSVSLQCHTNNKGIISRNLSQEYESYSVSSKISVLNLHTVFQIILCEAIGYSWRCLRRKMCSCSTESESHHFYLKFFF